VQLIVYRRFLGAIEYLVLKRTEPSGGWWQPITGHVESGENELEALWRELNEGTGAVPLTTSDEIYSYEYELPEGLGKDSVYAVEVHAATPVILDRYEHETYAWLALEEALQRLYYEENRENFRRVHAIIG